MWLVYHIKRKTAEIMENVEIEGVLRSLCH